MSSVQPPRDAPRKSLACASQLAPMSFVADAFEAPSPAFSADHLTVFAGDIVLAVISDHDDVKAQASCS